MAYRTGSPSHELDSPVLTRDLIDTPQRVTVSLHGFDIPGEIIFADLWQPWFGAELPEQVMFRLVLLSLSQRVDRADVTDRSIIVAVPAPELTKRDAERLSQMQREVARLNEIRERYLVSTDTGLRHLSTSLTQKVSEASVDITRAHVEHWRKGQVVVASNSSISTFGDALFIGDDPQAWAEAAAAAIFSVSAGTRSDISELVLPESLFTAQAEDRERFWRTGLNKRLQYFTDSDLNQILTGMSTLLTDRGGTIGGKELRTYLLRETGLPPGLAWLCLTAFVRTLGGEAAISPSDQSRHTRLDTHTLSSFSYQPEMIYSVDLLSDSPESEWITDLPYVRVFIPHAQDTATSPTPAQNVQLIQALETAESRFSLAVHTLRSAVGPPIETVSSSRSTEQLINVLKAHDWKGFLEAATRTFPDANKFAEAVKDASRLRTLAQDIIDVRTASEYVSMADFGRADHTLESEAELLKVRLNINEVVEGQIPALSLPHEFQQWRRRYSNVYRTFHEEKRQANRLLTREIRRADAQFRALKKLTAFPGFETIVPPDFEAAWAELKKRSKPCSVTEDSQSLTERPYCTECGARLGAPDTSEEVEAAIADINDMMRATSVRFSKIAADRVLSGQREDELKKLIQINSIADLTAVADILEPGVLEFLERFTDDQSGKSGQ
jgi:hypothetical protein